MRSLLAKFYPDGTASVTRKREFKPPHLRKACSWSPEKAFRQESIRVLGAQQIASLRGFELGVGGTPPFPCQEIQKSVNSQKPLRLGLTARAQKTLRRAFAAWESVTSPGTMAFGTLTLSDAAVAALLSAGQSCGQDCYQGAVSRFMERLRKLLKSRGLPGDVIWVTELHPSRSQREGICIPHVHFVCQTAFERYRWLIKPSEISALWESAISAYTNVDEGKRFPSRCEIRCVKKSVGRYVAKYLSKSKRQAILDAENLDTSMVPERWYAVANALHKLVRKQTVVFRDAEAAGIMDWMKEEGNPLVKRWGNITIPGDGGRDVWLASWFILHCPVDSEGIRLLALSES